VTRDIRSSLLDQDKLVMLSIVIIPFLSPIIPFFKLVLHKKRGPTKVLTDVNKDRGDIPSAQIRAHIVYISRILEYYLPLKNGTMYAGHEYKRQTRCLYVVVAVASQCAHSRDTFRISR
jgi:hypothetical protein